jgi:predicted DNA binding protein
LIYPKKNINISGIKKSCMFEIKFKILHKGCWMQGISKKFKSRFISHSTFGINRRLTSDIVHVVGKTNSEFERVISFIRRNKQIKKFELLHKDEKNLYFQIYTSIQNSIIGNVTKFGGFILKPIVLDNGWEVWTIMVASKEQLPQLLGSLNKCGKVVILSIKKSSLDNSNLSPKQSLVIGIAIKLGYYEWPRKISAKELAKRLKISKATVLQHLRVGEAKIIKSNYLS